MHPDQPVLVAGLARDWTRVELAALPALTDQAYMLLDALDRQARKEGWLRRRRASSVQLLRILLAWLGAAAQSR